MKKIISPNRVLEFNLGAGVENIKFSSYHEFIYFLDQEQNFLNSILNKDVLNNYISLLSSINQKFGMIRSDLRGIDKLNDGNIYRNDAHFMDLDDSDINLLMSDIYINYKLPLSNSKIAKYITNLSNEDPLVAAAALATWMNQPIVNFSNFQELKGALLIVAFDAKFTDTALESTKADLLDLNNKLNQSIIDIQSKSDYSIGKFNDIANNSINNTTSIVRRKFLAWKKYRTKKDNDISIIMNRVEQAEKALREQMKLKAPVQYWLNKANNHKLNASKYKRILLYFSSISGVILIASLYFIASHAIDIADKNKPAAVYLLLVTLGVVITTIVFWAARILMRLFLSEHHLAIDAEERSVMTETYLALTAESSASDEDRSIILTSLFRPTSDGIVKDDAAPDFSPASLLSKFTTR